jgi:transcriptional regulator with XRE-family HTH domain
MSPGELLREARKRHGVSQKRLAIRAGTTQSAISRIECDRVSPSVDTLRELLHMAGEDLLIASEPRDAGIDTTLVESRLAESMTERLDLATAMTNQFIELSPRPKRPEFGR